MPYTKPMHHVATTLTPEERGVLDRWAAEHNVSVAWVLRRGLASVVDDLADLIAGDPRQVREAGSMRRD